jgi:hypothetical protein
MGMEQQLEHKAFATAAMGYGENDFMLAQREALESAIFQSLKGELLCKTSGAVARFTECNEQQLAEIASIVMQHWDDTAEAGRLIRQKFNVWMWDAAEHEAANV